MSVGRWYQELHRLDRINTGTTSTYCHDGVTGREIMLTRHGHHITAVSFSDRTGITEVTLQDGSTDNVYVRQDQHPTCRPVDGD